jgi:TatD DNase family protein
MAAMLEAGARAAPFKLLMHCYTSGLGLLHRAAALGAWFSVSGIATFKNAEDVREAVRAMPEDRIIVETDCPYLAPVPHRGRRNEPAYVGLVLDKLAEIRGWTRAEAEARTEAAFFALFDRIPAPARVGR